MLTEVFRISHNDVAEYHTIMSRVYKEFQETEGFTDLDFFCEDGYKVSVHKSVILRYSPNLESLLSKQMCCFCHGSSCCNNSGEQAITLADIKASTLSALVDFLYTGRAYFASRDECQEMIELKELLGLKLPPSIFNLEVMDDGQSVAFENIPGILSRVRKSISTFRGQPEQRHDFDEFMTQDFIQAAQQSRVRAASAVEPQTASSSKRARTESGATPQPFVDTEDKRQCHQCKKFWGKRWYKRHLNTCKGKGSVNESLPSAVFNQPTVQTSDPHSRMCPNCKKTFTTRGGWFTRHVNKCEALQQPVDSNPQIESPPRPTPTSPVAAFSNQPPAPVGATLHEANTASTSAEARSAGFEERATCPGCNESFTKRGGWYSKHILYCVGGAKPVFAKSDLTCPKCGKVYSPHCRRFLKTHIEDCQGNLDTDGSPEASGSDQSPAPNPVLPCKTCGAQFTTNDDLKAHLKGCKPQKSQSQSDENGDLVVLGTDENLVIDIDKAREMYENGEWSCYLCGNNYSKRETFKSHLTTHFRVSLQTLEPEVFAAQECNKCPYVCKDKNSLYNHMSLTHQLLRKFIPEVLADILFVKSTTESSAANSKASGWTCFVCHAGFPTKNPMRQHMVGHFRSEIKDKYMNKLDMTLCPYCEHRSQNSDHMIVHIAWTHKKLKDLLSPDDCEYLFGRRRDSSEASRSADNVEPTKAASQVASNNQEFEPSEAPTQMMSASNATQASTAGSQDFDPTEAPTQQLAGPSNSASVGGATAAANKNGLECYFCDRTSNKRSDLKYHLYTHLKQKMMDKYFSEGPSKACPYCTYKANSSEHNLVHISLTHQKICEYLPDEYATHIFGKNRKATADVKTSALNCPICSKISGSASDHSEENCPRKICFSCHLCSNVFDHPNSVSAHYYSRHFRAELKNEVAKTQQTSEGTFTCSLCDFQHPTVGGLAFHLCCNHNFFLKFVPDDLRAKYEQFVATNSEKSPPSINGNVNLGISPVKSVVANGRDQQVSCSNCQLTFENQLALTRHSVEDKCRAQPSKFGGPGVCYLCKEDIGSFLQYKCHLFGHFEKEINDDLGTKYEASSGKCHECRGNDSFTAGTEMCDEGRQAFVRHLALDHDKIFDFLNPDIREHMRSAFNDGSVALPPTPPPPVAQEEQKSFTDSLTMDNDIEANDEINEEIQIQIEAVEDVVNPEEMTNNN